MNRNRLYTDNTIRRCSRCGDALTDPASRECGVGPVCRKKDTHLYAKTIVANFGIATVRALSMHENMLASEVVDTWKDTVQKLLKAAEKVANITDDATIMQRTGADLRAVVRACDLICSYEHPDYNVRKIAIDVVQACGYIGLAAVLSGEASTSPSKVWFENGRVYMTGLGNKSGWAAMRQIPGITTPKYRGDRAPYSAPAAHAESFIDNVRRYWPMYEGDINQVQSEAANWVANNPVRSSIAATSTTPVHSFVATLRSQDFTVQFPWVRNQNMFELLNQFKAIPAKDRSYDAVNRIWSFTINHLDRILDLAKNSNMFEDIRKVETDTETPVGIYGARSVARRTYRQWNTYHGGRYYGNMPR